MNNEHLCGLIELVGAQRDRAAFSELFLYFGPRFKGYAMRTGCRDAEAEELAQEAMISVWRRADSFDRLKANATTWMFAIVRNKRIDLVRREKYPSAELEEVEQRPADTADPGVTYDAAKAGEVLRQALKTLPLEQEQVMQKAFFEEKSHSVIAEELQLPLGTVKSRIRLALSRLRISELEAYA